MYWFAYFLDKWLVNYVMNIEFQTLAVTWHILLTVHRFTSYRERPAVHSEHRLHQRFQYGMSNPCPRIGRKYSKNLHFFTCIDIRQHVYLAVKFKIYEMYFTCMILGLRHVFLPETKVVWSAPPLQRIPGDRKHRAWPQTDGQNLGTRPVHNQRKDRQIPYCHCTQQNDVHISRRIGAVQC